MRETRHSRTTHVPSEVVSYRGYDLLPEVALVPQGELFGGTWIVRCCSIGTRSEEGYEVRSLLGDNDHFSTRREAVQTALKSARRTIELGEVGAVHLCPPARGVRERKRAHRRGAPTSAIFA